jgi:hypothetical protein
MTEPQPPAGWYPDPNDAAQQRYWDGSTWTGHTAPAATSVSAPSGDAPVGGAALPTGAPTWTMQPGMMPAPQKKAFFKRTWVLVTAAVIVVLVVLGVVFSSSDHSNAMASWIKKSGQSQLQKTWSAEVPGATVKVGKVDCVKTGGTQQYSCLVNYTVTAQGETKGFFQHVSGECDNDANCIYHTTDTPQLNGSGDNSDS